VTSRIERLLALRGEETAPVLLSTLLFWLLLTAHYILRPLREEMGLNGGVENLPSLFMVTLSAMILVAPLLGWLVRSFRREVFIPVALWFFAANLLLFYAAMRLAHGDALVMAGRAFYVWEAVFNVCVLSLFWAFMADGFGYERSRRLFGIVAVGGTVGAVTGSALTTSLVESVGRPNLFLAAVVMLLGAAWTVRVLARVFDSGRTGRPGAGPAGGSILAGITRTLRSPYLLGISLYIFFYTLTATFLYFEQARIIAANVLGRDARAAMFGAIDLWTNILTLGCQLFFTGRLLKKLGTGWILALLPLIVGVGFAALGAWPTLAVLVVFQVARRAGNYALAKPARETLFTVVPREDRYKAKNFIDTFVYRGGDALGAGIFARITSVGVVSVAWLAVPVAAVWLATAMVLGRRQKQLATAGDDAGAPAAPAAGAPAA